MGIQGLSSSSPIPEGDEYKEGRTAETNEQSNVSIFAEFNDSDGNVDINDVVYKNNAKEDSIITKFLIKHSSEKWSDSLLQKINFYIEQFNTMMSRKSGSPKPARDEFDAYTKEAFSEFNAADARNKAEAEAFKQNAEGKFLELENNNKNLTKGFKISSMKSVLDDLENGYSGAIVADKGSIILTYDSENKTFVLERSGNKQPFDKEKLSNVLSIIAENATSIVGKSRKVVNN